MKIAIFFLLMCTGFSSWAQLSRDQVTEMLDAGDPNVVVNALTREGLGFEPDEALLTQLCAHPQILRLLLTKLVQIKGGEGGVRPLLATEIAEDPNALVIQKIYELTNNLTVANRMETTPEVIDRRLGFRDFLVRTLMEPNHQVDLKTIEKRLGSDDFLPPWVKTLVNSSVAAKDNGYPVVTFKADRSANLTLSTSERGVHGYLGLFMINGQPENEGFNLEESLIFSKPEFPMNYDTKTAEFQPGKIEKTLITTLNLTKIFKKTQPLTLFPGTWGMRFKHTNGEHSLRSNRTVYFKVEAGQNYDMRFSWETDGKGLGQMKMDLVPVDPR